MDFATISNFFLSKSGSPINLASAKNYTITDYEKEKKNLNPTFVKAVDLLRECGFVNVEFTSARR